MSQIVRAGSSRYPLITKQQICPYVGKTETEAKARRSLIDNIFQKQKNPRVSSFLFGDLITLERFCTNKSQNASLASQSWGRTKDLFQGIVEEGRSFPELLLPAGTRLATPPPSPVTPERSFANVTAGRNFPRIAVKKLNTSPSTPSPLPEASPALPGVVLGDVFKKATEILDKAAEAHGPGVLSQTADIAAINPRVPAEKGCEPCAPCAVPGKGGRRKTRYRRKLLKRRKTLKRQRHRK